MQGWSYTAGEHGHQVTVYERRPGGNIYRRFWDAARGVHDRRSLGHTDRAKARRYADERALKLKYGERHELDPGNTTLAALLALYIENETPEKSERVQQEDRRRQELVLTFFGSETNPEEIPPSEWKRFMRERSSGKIDARGNYVEKGNQKKRRPRVVRGDLSWLRTVVRWGCGWTVREPGRGLVPLVRSNPLEGKNYKLPPDNNPRRPVITHDTHLALVDVAADVSPLLADLLVVANGTGRRLSAFLALTPADYRSERTTDEPHGAIIWPEDTDKSEKEWRCPIAAEVREVIERRISELQVVGRAPIFPSPRLRDSKPASRDHARKLLLAAFRAAEKKRAEERPDEEPIEKPEGSAWHVYRRKFVTERPHMPDSLVARLAGMSEETVKLYRQHHPAGMYEALSQPMHLRTLVKGGHS